MVSYNNSKQVPRESSPDEYATEVHGEKQRDSGKSDYEADQVLLTLFILSQLKGSIRRRAQRARPR